jgi:hypothetical protein
MAVCMNNKNRAGACYKTRQPLGSRAVFAVLLGCWSFTGLATAASATKSSAQPGASPPGLSQPGRAILPSLSPALVDALKRQDVTQTKGRFQVGIGRTFDQPIVVNRSAVPAAEWTVLSNGWRSWSAEITSEGALGQRLHLENVALPQNARVLIYDPANPAAAPAVVSAQDVAGRHDVWVETVFAERVRLECQVPPGADLSGVTFTVSELSHIYQVPSFATNTKEAAGTCNLDVTCYPAYAQDASGVAHMEFVDGGNTYFCTGCLLASSDVSKDYFLSAHHCITSQTVASTVELFWFYQTSVCNGPAPSLTNAPTTTGGGDLLAGSAVSDFAFLRLRHAVPANAWHLAWTTNQPALNAPVTGIHHPSGDYKRISFGKVIDSDSDFWAVQWSSGVTEPGSSGSPLLNANHEVLGQLNGGFNGPGSSCSSPSAPDQYGRFDVTYKSIRPWLGGSGSQTNGFVPPRGTYNGLFSDPTNGVSQDSSGFFTITTTTRGTFSGRLQLGAGRYSMRGKFDGGGNAEVIIARRNLDPLTVELQIDPSDPDAVTGTVSDGNFTAQLSADRAIYDGRTSIAPETGQYTMIIPGNSDPSAAPGGDSYGTVTVDKLGRIRLSASLADGTRISQSVTISKNGTWPLYISLYGGQGSLFSWVSFASTDTSDFSGNLSWIKPEMLKAKYYWQGFAEQSAIVGSSYLRPPRGSTVVNFSSGAVVLQGGNLSEVITNQVALDPNNRVVNLSDNKLSLSFSTSTGLFSGRVVDPSTLRTLTFRGVVLQKQNSGAGLFLGVNESGEVLLEPQ